MLNEDKERLFVRELVTASVLIAFGVALPIIFHIVGPGQVFLPMHLPVLAAGLLLSPCVASAVGLCTPLLSTALTNMPPISFLPIMIIELVILAFSASVFTRLKIPILVAALLAIAARCVATFFITAFFGQYLGIPPEKAGIAALLIGIPGIMIQLTLAPSAVSILKNTFNRSAI